MSEKIMLVETIEDIIDDGEVVGKLCSNRAGEQVKVKKGQGGSLIKRWDELQGGLAYKFTMGEFKGYPYVQDFKKVANIMEAQAAARVADTQADSKTRAFSLSYAKDVTVALIQVSEKHFDIEKITPKQARGIANLTKAIASEYNTWLISQAEIDKKIEEAVGEGYANKEKEGG